jgi:hypothetical protein
MRASPGRPWTVTPRCCPSPSRFNLQAGDLCYAQAQGDIQPIINPDGPNGSQPSSRNTPMPPANSGGWDYYDPWVWTSWFPMVEASAASIPWMFATGNHEPELFSSHVAADKATVDNYEAHGYGGLKKRLAAWRRDPRVDFIVAFFHECAFSTCNGHSSDGGVRAKLAPLFSRYQVDLAVQGHDWSQARYADYGFIALDVTPAARGHRTTMVLRFINEQGRELDRAVFSRTAGEVLH